MDSTKVVHADSTEAAFEKQALRRRANRVRRSTAPRLRNGYLSKARNAMIDLNQ